MEAYKNSVAVCGNCLNVGSDYVEKQLSVSNNDTLVILFYLLCSFFFTTKWSLLSG